MLKNKSKSFFSALAIAGTLFFSQVIVNASVLNGWEQNGTAWYYFINGSKITGWNEIDGKNYYFNSEGFMASGWFVLNGKTYYFNDRNGRVTGWNVIDRSTYYFDIDGAMVTGWKVIEGKTFYFNERGEMAVGIKAIGDKTYYFTDKGEMATGWYLVNDKWLYFNSKGEMAKGILQIGTKTYYFDTTGEMLTGFIDVNGKKYFFNADGEMGIGWILNNGKWYYFYISGEMAKGWVPFNGKWYYQNTDGAMALGWIQLNEKWYYLNSGGDMAVNTITPDGYKVGADGAWDGQPKSTNGGVYAPTGVTAKALSSNLVQLQWNKSPDADYYYCYWSNAISKGYTSFKNPDGTKRQFQWQSAGYTLAVDMNNITFFKVTAVKDGIESAASTIVSSITESTTVFPLLSDVPMPLYTNYYKTTITADEKMAVYYFYKTSVSSTFIANYTTQLENKGWSAYTEDITYTGSNSKYLVKDGNFIILSSVGDSIVVMGNIH